MSQHIAPRIPISEDLFDRCSRVRFVLMMIGAGLYMLSGLTPALDDAAHLKGSKYAKCPNQRTVLRNFGPADVLIGWLDYHVRVEESLELFPHPALDDAAHLKDPKSTEYPFHRTGLRNFGPADVLIGWLDYHVRVRSNRNDNDVYPQNLASGGSFTDSLKGSAGQ
ncbi:hypothetical protein BLNAU_6177 [Blattamonas nauphoetae]|uniref:Uncharacterized protein n=1 Tax=Blattamonas nauphoetae TaxID=2049346 RepID=A0ABQ9Y5F9_9EUKA|nr:hypothetical protein BLNAU_6177 [Blattamonas nauphoetae]